MITLNSEILKGLKYETESDFDRAIYEYFLEFEEVFNDPNYLSKKKYIEKFSFIYNLCNRISILKNSESIYDVYLFYKFIYARMDSFLKCYISGLRHKITDFESLLSVYSETFKSCDRINGVLEYFNKEIKGISNITENSKGFKALSIETWNTQINLLPKIQEIIVNYVFDLYINFSDEVNKNLNEFIKKIVLYENNYIENRYWFLSKMVTKKIIDHLKLKNVDIEIDDLLKYLKETHSKYKITYDFCDTYFVPEFESIGNECCLFIIENYIINRSEEVIDCIKNLLIKGDWKTFKKVLDILTKIDESDTLNTEIKNWGLENMIKKCCEKGLESEKSKFKENKYSNICKYLNYYKKVESLLRDFDDLYILQLESTVKQDLNKCYNKNLGEDGATPDQNSQFAIDLADFIYKFLSNYEKSKTKFDLVNEENLRILKIFLGLIQNNDAFQIMLQKFLAKRLFSKDVCDRDIYFMREIAKVDTLDVISSRVNTMIKDYNNFHNINTNFKTVCDYYYVDTNYKVITDVIWGIKETRFMDEQAGYKINRLPDDIKCLTDDFTNFYQVCHENRKLKWNFSFSEFEMDFNIGGETYLIKTTFPMAQILLYFNKKDKMMKIDVVREKISLKNIDYLKRLEIIKEVGDHYVINESFTGDPSQPIMLSGTTNTIKRIEAEPKTKTDTLEIDDMLQAFLVKTMKALGREVSIKRDILIKDCIERVKYRVEVDRSRVNKQIKKLVDGEYLKINEAGDVVYNP